LEGTELYALGWEFFVRHGLVVSVMDFQPRDRVVKFPPGQKFGSRFLL